MASSSSSSPIGQKREVFLSFRGEDTRYNFTSHLHKALIEKSIDTFIDNNLERGEEISAALLKTIEESMISIVILSQNYASSSWCLDELSKIIECNERNGQIVVPIFYHVDPSDVRKQTGSFAEAFAKYEERFKDMTDKVGRWRAALTEVGSVSGWHLQNDRAESTVLDDIVEDIMKKLDHTSSGHTSSVDFNGLVGIDSRIEQIEPLLDIGLESACFAVGIWGMGGIGKTTIARAIFDKFSSKFKGCCFLENVREESKKDGVVSLGKKLLGEILGDENIKRGTVNLGSNFISNRLGREKFLVVLDDVDDSSHLESIIGRFNRFGKRSRIIITTRDRHVLKNGVKIYEVDKLNDHEALRLFSWEAFKQDYPIEDFKKLSEMVVNYAQGIPLALKVLGSFLGDRSKRGWESALDRLKESPFPTIQKVLRISYDGLEHSKEKEIFCDIACFFKGWDKDRVMTILDGCGLFSDIGIDILAEKSLITISKNNILGMHDLLQEMGWEIVREESDNRGKRSRLWNGEDVYDVLTRGTGTEEVKGIFFGVSKKFWSEVSSDRKAVSRMCRWDLSSTAFQGMCSLRFLKLNCELSFPYGLLSLSDELRYLEWWFYPLESLPPKFNPENLVELILVYGKVKHLWKGTWHLSKLKVITLDYCKELIKIPDLSEAKNLEHMRLFYCTSLPELPSLRNLSSLRELRLNGCYDLKELPDDLSNLTSLAKLSLQDCFNLKELPNGLGNLTSLTELDLSRCLNLKELPNGLGNLTSLTKLDLSRCSNLKELPNGLGNLTSLTELNLSNCSNLKELPNGLGNLTSLTKLDLSRCSNLKELPNGLGNLTSLTELDLSDCSNLKELPNGLGNLSCLTKLYLFCCSNMKELPNGLGNLSCLTELRLSACFNLTELPNGLGNLSCLTELRLSGCSNLKELPNGLGNLSCLTELYLSDCYDLKELPNDLGNLSCLIELNLSGCLNLKELPNSLSNLSSLQSLDLSLSNIVSIPASFEHLSQLVYLNLTNCMKLQTLSRLPSCLKIIVAKGCKSLQTVSISSSTRSIRVRRTEGCFLMQFIYCNCLKLDQNSRNNIEADAQLKVQLLTTIIDEKKNGYIRETEFGRHFFRGSYNLVHPRIEVPGPYNLVCPGSEVPKWFSYKSGDSWLTAKLPPDGGNSKFCGFALCVIVASVDDDEDGVFVYCNMETHNGKHRSLYGCPVRYEIESEHMFLWYVSCGELGEIFGDDCYCGDEISFRFFTSEKCGTDVKKCGVHPLYAKDEDGGNGTKEEPPVKKLKL